MEEIQDDTVLKALKFLRTETEKKTGLLDGAQRINLRFNLFKLPTSSKTDSKQVKVELKHRLPHRDICLIVADGANRKNRANIDDTIEHYEEMFRKAGVTGIQEIIPVLKLKLDYQNYEAKRNLASRYDTVMADSRIVRFLPSMLGKHFYGAKRHPLQVELNKGAEGLAARFKRYMNTHICPISLTGVGSSMVVGQLDMADDQLVDNVRAAIDKVVDNVPGGGQNIFSLNLSLDNSPLIPIYMSTVDRSLVPVPDSPDWMESQKEAETVEGEVSTVKGTVTISPDGVVTVTKPDGSKLTIGTDNEISIPDTNTSRLGLPTNRMKARRAKRKNVSKLSLTRNANTPKKTHTEADSSVPEGEQLNKVQVKSSTLRRKRRKPGGGAAIVTSEEKTTATDGKQSAEKRKAEQQVSSSADVKPPKTSRKSSETSSIPSAESKTHENSADGVTPPQTKLSARSKKTPLKPQNSPRQFNSSIDKPSRKSPKVAAVEKMTSPKTPAAAPSKVTKKGMSGKKQTTSPSPMVEDSTEPPRKSRSKKTPSKLVSTPSSAIKVLKKPNSATKPSPVMTRSRKAGVPAKTPSKTQNSAVKKTAKLASAVKG